MWNAYNRFGIPRLRVGHDFLGNRRNSSINTVFFRLLYAKRRTVMIALQQHNIHYRRVKGNFALLIFPVRGPKTNRCPGS